MKNIFDIINPRTKKQWLIDSALLALTVIVASLYFLFNVPHDIVHILKTSLDEAIPRLAVFSVPYLLFLPWFWLVVFYAWVSNKAFLQLVFAVIIANLVAFFVYTVYQTHVPRDPILEGDIFSEILRFIYGHDQAYAGFPSLHSGLSAIVATYFIKIKSNYSWLFILTAVIIVLSTLFTKQHFVLDAVSGIALGVLATIASFKIIPDKSKTTTAV